MIDFQIVDNEWAEPDPRMVAKTLKGAKARWWLCGGIGLDLLVGRKTRDHHDVDVAILRDDQLKFRTHLDDWEICIATGWHDGKRVVVEWREGILPQEVGVVRCRRFKTDPWMFELMLNDSLDGYWLFKRNHNIRMPLKDIGTEIDGLPCVVPEVALLYKATSSTYGPVADLDFYNVVPMLSHDQKAWLRESISVSHPNHPWLSHL